MNLSTDIPLPDIEHQFEVEKLYENSSNNCEALTAELTSQLDLVKQLHQSFLREAMQGKLVPQDPKDEPASELLQKVKAALRQAQGDKKGKKQKELPPVKEDEIPFEIPENWVWCRVGEMCTLKRGKSKHRPRNDKRLFEKGTYPFIQTGDVSKAKLKI